jgi:hypothetical protein
MYKIRLLVILSVLLTTLPGQIPAVENCEDVVYECFDFPGCVETFEWLTPCIGNSKTFKCSWSGGPGCDHNGEYYIGGCNCGGGGCFLAGTPIALADGSTKPVEAIRQGDQVLAYSESGGVEAAHVVAIHAPRAVDHYFVINGGIRITATQPVLSRGKWVLAEDLKIGDVVTSQNGLDTPIFAKRWVDAEATVYSFQASGGTYVAHGIVVHNKDYEMIYICPWGECPGP